MTRIIKIMFTYIAIILLVGCAGSGGGQSTVQSAATDLTAVWAQMKVLNDMIVGLGIDQLKAKVDALAANDAALQAALDKEIADAAAHYATINSQITDTNTQLADVKTVLAALQTQLNNTIATMATQADVANLQSQITSAVANITSNTSSIMTLQTQVAAVQLTITALQANDAVTDAQIASLQANIATLQATVANLQAQITAIAGGMVKLTATVVGSGTISPTQQYWPKNIGGATFTATPSAGNYFAGITGCAGTLNGTTFTTSALLADCTLTATFTPSPVYYFASQFGTEGAGNGQFTSVSGIVVDDSGNIYTAEDNVPTERIQKFDSSGNYMLQFGSYGTGNGQFSDLNGLTLDATGNIYTVEGSFFNGNNRIQKFDSSGNFLMKFGAAGFSDPQQIVVDTAGNIWVYDAGNHNVQKFDSAGNYLLTINGILGQQLVAAGIAVDANNNMYIANANGMNHIYKFDSSGTYVSTLFGSSIGYMNIKNNKIYMGTSPGVQIFDLAGNYIAQYSSTGAYKAVDSNDNLYMVFGSAVQKILH